jgi:hypothetical protein
MSDKDDEYRKRAAEAQGWADRLLSPLDKEAWLRVAQGWLGLIRKPRLTPQETFNERVKDVGTGQDPSESSH